MITRLKSLYTDYYRGRFKELYSEYLPNKTLRIHMEDYSENEMYVDLKPQPAPTNIDKYLIYMRK